MDTKTLCKCITIAFILLNIQSISAQNMLNTSTWTVGSGSDTGFSQYGVTEENSRVYKEDHLGNEVIVWQASPNGDSGKSGGFASANFDIDHTKYYRLTVWIKKTNSNDGGSYFKCQSYVDGASHILRLNGTTINWPNLWNGDLPQLDRWYLLVGYVHSSDTSITTNYGKIYDGVTGEIVQTITDYKFSTTATKLMHRAFLYNDTNLLDRQHMYDPRIEVVDGSEASIDELFKINPNSTIKFEYDTAGNQTKRYYCPNGDCIISKISDPEKEEESTELLKETKEEEQKTENDILVDNIILYPNPTEGMVKIKFNSNSDVTISKSIIVYNAAGILVRKIPSDSKNKMEIDLTNLPIGTYLIHIHLSDGKSVTKKIIKQ